MRCGDERALERVGAHSLTKCCTSSRLRNVCCPWVTVWTRLSSCWQSLRVTASTLPGAHGSGQRLVSLTPPPGHLSPIRVGKGGAPWGAGSPFCQVTRCLAGPQGAVTARPTAQVRGLAQVIVLLGRILRAGTAVQLIPAASGLPGLVSHCWKKHRLRVGPLGASDWPHVRLPRSSGRGDPGKSQWAGSWDVDTVAARAPAPGNTTREELGQNKAHPHSGPGWGVRMGHACPENTDARCQAGGRPCSARAVGTVPSTAALKSQQVLTSFFQARQTGWCFWERQKWRRMARAVVAPSRITAHH